MITKIEYKDQDEFEIKLIRLGWIQRGMSGALWQDPNDPYESCFTKEIAMARVVAWEKGSEYQYPDLAVAFNESCDVILCNTQSASTDLISWLCEFTTSRYHDQNRQVKIIKQRMIELAGSNMLQLSQSDYDKLKEVS